jgi:hypothetical protein
MTLRLSPREPPRRQLRSWLSPSYHTCHTVHTLCHVTFSPKVKEDICAHVYDSNEEAERTVSTLTKKQSVEFFCDGFEKFVHLLWNCVENGVDSVEQ